MDRKQITATRASARSTPRQKIHALELKQDFLLQFGIEAIDFILKIKYFLRITMSRKTPPNSYSTRTNFKQTIR